MVLAEQATIIVELPAEQVWAAAEAGAAEAIVQ